MLQRLHRQAEVSADPVLAELRDYPLPSVRGRLTALAAADDGTGVLVPLQLATEGGVLSMASTTTVFGTPVDVTLSEIALECFFPADADSAERLRRSRGR